MSANDKSIAISSQDQSSFKRSVTIRTGLNALESIPSLRETESAAKTDLNISESISSLKRRVSLKKTETSCFSNLFTCFSNVFKK
ncbi:hypothetical protein [Candidatus Rhabdochlamydia porcellionis]|jgi:hypothetical protein|uniref:Uncharacterized protein n=1 Tax=Candidatus Rhabdochlamydia porcellionis TaxID=225148 RepID=A0ABX8Z0S4_9BACT|nr:hypothetical protein [Candidatus Rhabdochlamydia porcellionis]QZA59271.1 hypothetical protein RHAB15C_0001157 [Candidatus Rhabdochlamydia porcellionis]